MFLRNFSQKTSIKSLAQKSRIKVPPLIGWVGGEGAGAGGSGGGVALRL